MNKLSSILIGIVIVGTIISLFGLSLTNVTTETGQTYDNSIFTGLDHVSEVQAQSLALKNNLTQLQTSSTLLSKLDAIWGAGVSTLGSFIGSFTVADDLATSTIGKLNLGDSTTYVVTAIITIIVIILVFILLRALLKVDI